MNKTIMKLLFAFLFLSFIGLPNLAYSAFDLHIQSIEGSKDLRFEKINAQIPSVSKALTIAINTPGNQQKYQLVQTLLEPLSNSQGVILPESNFSVYAIKEGNIAGTLSVEQKLTVPQGRTIIYTSDTQGAAASFTLVYVLNSSKNILPGSYRGKLVFTLETLGETQPLPAVIITVSADIESIGTQIDVTTVTGVKSIVLNSSKAESSSFDVAVNIKESLPEQFEITQYMTKLPESREGKQLLPEVLILRSHDQKKGIGTAGNIPLSIGEHTLYIAAPGKGEEHFIVTYNLVNAEKQKTGNYKTEVQYFLKTQTAQMLLANFPLEVTIERVFDLTVTPDQDSGIQFRDVPLDKIPRRSEMLVEVHSNLGRQYQVSQQLPVALVNAEGQTITPKYFTLRLADIGTKGSLQFIQPREVETGEMVLFLSDKEGSSDKFKIIYEFSADASVETGDYIGKIVYTISEL